MTVIVASLAGWSLALVLPETSTAETRRSREAAAPALAHPPAPSGRGRAGHRVLLRGRGLDGAVVVPRPLRPGHRPRLVRPPVPRAVDHRARHPGLRRHRGRPGGQGRRPVPLPRRGDRRAGRAGRLAQPVGRLPGAGGLRHRLLRPVPGAVHDGRRPGARRRAGHRDELVQRVLRPRRAARWLRHRCAHRRRRLRPRLRRHRRRWPGSAASCWSSSCARSPPAARVRVVGVVHVVRFRGRFGGRRRPPDRPPAGQLDGPRKAGTTSSARSRWFSSM